MDDAICRRPVSNLHIVRRWGYLGHVLTLSTFFLKMWRAGDEMRDQRESVDLLNRFQRADAYVTGSDWSARQKLDVFFFG